MTVADMLLGPMQLGPIPLEPDSQIRRLAAEALVLPTPARVEVTP
jgi:hypothetical protein